MREQKKIEEIGGVLVALGAKFIGTKVVQCCGEKVSPLYCCYMAPPVT